MPVTGQKTTYLNCSDFPSHFSLGDTFTTAKLGDGFFATQSVQNNADLFFGLILLARCPANVLDRLGGTGLSYLRFLEESSAPARLLRCGCQAASLRSVHRVPGRSSRQLVCRYPTSKAGRCASQIGLTPQWALAGCNN